MVTAQRHQPRLPLVLHLPAQTMIKMAKQMGTLWLVQMT